MTGTKYDLSDERKFIKSKIDGFKSYVEKYGHDVFIKTQQGYLYMSAGIFNYEISKTRYLTSMARPDPARDQYLLLVTTDEGHRIMDAISISFSTLFDFAVDDICNNVLMVQREHENSVIADILDIEKETNKIRSKELYRNSAPE